MHWFFLETPQKSVIHVYIYISNANSIDYSLPSQENDAFYSNRKSTLSFQTYNFYLEILKSPKPILVACVGVLGDTYVWISGLMWKKNTLSNTNSDRKVDIKRSTISNLSCNEIKITKIYL